MNLLQTQVLIRVVVGILFETAEHLWIKHRISTYTASGTENRLQKPLERSQISLYMVKPHDSFSLSYSLAQQSTKTI